VHNFIEISGTTNHVPQQSDTKSSRFVFSYTITIKNNSDTTVQLLSRHWIIQDANKKIEEVYGEGVIGQQPLITPGNEFSYSSGAVLETEIGTMEGRYFFVDKGALEKSEEFAVVIPKFVLSVPRVLH
jgi:ApaG protein